MEHGELDLLTKNEAGLVIEDTEAAILDNTIKWGRIFVITVWSLSALLVLTVLLFALAGYNLLYKATAGNTMIMLAWLIYGIVILSISVFLFRFCFFCRRAIHNQNLLTFNKALAALKYYFITNGLAGLLYLIYTLAEYMRNE